MKNCILKRVLAMAVVSSVLLLQLPATAAFRYITDIGFDDAITNDRSENVTTEGSASARIVEDGKVNKSYMVECGNVDNTIRILLPENVVDSKYIIQFDIRMEGEVAEGNITFSNPLGTKEELLTINEEGYLCAKDKRMVGNINRTRMATVSVMLDTELKLYSVGFDGKIKYYRHSTGQAMDNISEISIATFASKKDTRLFIDNIRVYNGDKIVDKKTSILYNQESIEYEPVDEAGLSDKIYYRNKIDSASAMSMTKLPKRNKIEFIEEDNGGFARITKETADDALFDVNIGQQTAKSVIAECDVRYDKNMPETMFYFRDYSGEAQVNFVPVVLKSDRVTAGNYSMQLRKNKWYKISVVMNIAKHVFDVYVDNKLMGENLSFTTDFSAISVWRMYVSASEMGSIDIDNMVLYGGTEPRNTDNVVVNATSRYSDTAALNFLRGKKAIHLYGNTVFVNGKKEKAQKQFIRSNDEILIDEETFEKFFGTDVTVSGNSVSVGKSSTMTVGSDKLYVGSTQYTLNAAPQSVDSVLYLPSSGYGKAANVNGFYDDEHGMIVIGSSIKATDNRIKQANTYMYFDRKSAQELQSIFMENTDNGAKHPRIIANADDFARLRNEVKTDSLKSQWFENIVEETDAILGQSVLEYKINGDRLLDVANAALARLQNLGFLYQITKEAKYAKKGIEELEAICNFPDWHPEHYLDTGTMATAVAIGYDWIYEYMTPEQRESIAKATHKFALETAKAAYYSSATFNDFWSDSETNWSIICNGGIANLAFATAEYNTEEAMETLRNALRSIEVAWYRIAPDGSWYEGTGYWGYLLKHLSLFMGSYESVMNDEFGKSYMGMDKYGYFQAYFQDPDGISNDFHDSDAVTVECDGQFYMAKIFDDTSLMLHRINQMKKYNVRPSVFDIIWCKAGIGDEEKEISFSNEKYFRETEFVAMREDWNSDASAWLSFHGGYSNNAHDHVDVGTFVYNIDGVRWAVEPGREMLSYVGDNVNPAILAGYDSKYFYRRKGEGHNIVVINPDENLEMDISAFAQVSKPVSGTTGAYSTIDLTSSYVENVEKYIRGYLMSDSRRTLTVRDEIKLKSNSEMYWFMNTNGQIRIIDNNTAIIYQDGKQLKLQFVTNAPRAELKAMNAEPLPTTPQFTNTENNDISKIAYVVNGSEQVNITVKLSLVGDVGSNSGVIGTNISQWDSLINIPAQPTTYKTGTGRLKAIYSNGKLVKNFAPDNFSYSVSCDINGNAPKISFESSERAETESYIRYDGKEINIIKVYDAEGNVSTYTVVIDEYDNTNIDVYDAYELAAIQASSEQIEAGENNCKEHSCDNDYSTRWSAKGINEWCIYDLGESKQIDAVAAAFWMGSQRQFNFEVAVSNDGKKFTKVTSATTKGNTDDSVVYVLDAPVNARYIKFIGFGSNTNEWNNVLEFMVLKAKAN